MSPDTWLPLSLFVAEDFDAMRIETVTPVDGVWPSDHFGLYAELRTEDLGRPSWNMG